ncbi:MAG: aminomethyl-transferring glycine dehydrogenase subunit GcvPB [Dehalococcoidia bacterium]|nr:aminomethyl-transferring glycine dehydrogenase subunit GcvPB [Dehalococcoidia bacterium]
MASRAPVSRALAGDEAAPAAALTFERGAPGRRAVDVPAWRGEASELPPAHLLRASLPLPELSQGELVRYYSDLASRNFGIDTGSYPLGSCTMKYNPKVDDLLASLTGFADLHPLAPEALAQGTLAVLFELQEALGAITGLPAVSLAPAAGAQGELAGILMVKRALEERGELARRRRVLVLDSAHGTNPATAAMAGFAVTELQSGPDGRIDEPALRAVLDDTVAAVMVTLPSTLGLWEPAIEAVARDIHAVGAYLYADGANLNAIVGRLRFGDVGFDVAHLNLHKTFSTPHGGGGPGAGPVLASSALARFLPTPVVARREADGEATYALVAPEASIGRMQQFHGSVGVLLRAYAYLRTLGLEGLRAVSENAVLNANYLRELLLPYYDLPFPTRVLHEVVFSATRQRREHGIRAYDIAKRLIDHGVHPPTVYFPLIVEEALMIEPTETESRESLERVAAAFIAIAEEAARDPEALHAAPTTAPIGRLDEALAARQPDLRWRPPAEA